MKKIMVNLISEQTIPVLQFIKEFSEMDKYVFITTKEMEEKRKTNSIINASSIKNSKIVKIEVNAESLKETEKKLAEFYDNFIEDDDQIFINVTTGTKLMAMAAYKIYSKFENVKIFYIPLKSKLLKQIHPEKKYNDKNLSYKITLEEYLTVYGINIINKSVPLYKIDTAETCFNLFKEGNLNPFLPKLMELRNSDKKTKKRLKKEGIFIKEIEKFEDIANKIFKNKDRLNYYDIGYLTGGWFEEFVYYKIQNQFKFEEKFIGLNYSISRVSGIDVKNEFDLLFIKDNLPYIIECKTSNYDSKSKRNFIQETIYKLSSLRKDFGLSAKAYIFTMDDKIKEVDKERANLNGIKIVDRVDIIENNFYNLF